MRKNIAPLQLITNENKNADATAQAATFCAGGGKWVQLRMKDTAFDFFFNTALKVQKICKRYGSALIINDNVEIAKKVNADGVHLGVNDMPAEKARQILGADKIIGRTANTLENIINAPLNKVDYIGLGPFRYTQTKENLGPTLGIAGYKNIFKIPFIKQLKIPIIAVGGIQPNDVTSILCTGIRGVAVSGAINNADNPQKTTENFLITIKSFSNEYASTANC